MSNLELLHYESKLVKPAKKPTKDRSRWITLLIVGCLLLATIVVGSVWLKSSNGSLVPPSVMDVVGEDPGFAIGQSSDTGGMPMWDIENRSESSLAITRIRLNNEFDLVPCGTWEERHFNSIPQKFPINLTIGASAHFTCHASINLCPVSYTKEVIFIDIDTNRGNFRYRVNGQTKRR